MNAKWRWEHESPPLCCHKGKAQTCTHSNISVEAKLMKTLFNCQYKDGWWALNYLKSLRTDGFVWSILVLWNLGLYGPLVGPLPPYLTSFSDVAFNTILRAGRHQFNLRPHIAREKLNYLRPTREQTNRDRPKLFLTFPIDVNETFPGIEELKFFCWC